MKSTLAIVLSAFLLTAFTAQAEETVLGSEDIARIFKGKRMAGVRAGDQVRIKFGEDGSLSIQIGHAVETGKWSVADGKLCLQVPKWNVDGCGKVGQEGKVVTQYFPDEKVHLVFGK